MAALVLVNSKNMGVFPDDQQESLLNMQKALQNAQLQLVFDSAKKHFIIPESYKFTIGTIHKFLQYSDYQQWHPEIIGTDRVGNKLIRLSKHIHSSL